MYVVDGGDDVEMNRRPAATTVFDMMTGGRQAAG
jgi:hypothetical protein